MVAAAGSVLLGLALSAAGVPQAGSPPAARRAVAEPAVEQAAEPAASEPAPPAAQPSLESERLYLSGTGAERPRRWEFRIDSGRRAGRWGVIAVPSNWELEGWGRFTHGKQWWRPAERAVYRTQFVAPARFRERRVELVFEGVMTDAEVWLNGSPVGEPHRGGFTRFAYDVSTRLRFDLPNRLEVRVAEASADPSVNGAEREADYWTFGGIYRPVYLEAHPSASIAHAAVDARHDGSLSVDVEVAARAALAVRARVESLEGEPLGEPLVAGGVVERARLEGRITGVEPWSAESPRLYRLWLELLTPEGELLHRRGLRIGFRTVELRAGQGLFVNQRRAVLRGVNRHSNWPPSGRAVPPAVNRRDVELIRSLNMNAVRTAHSPPDTEFLDACDELGIYVIDELPGWHDAYDTAVGSRLLREMVRRDVNHPSVILWANGNEGGWNRELDPLFGELDPQRRPVIHPGARALGFEASHYPSWDELRRLVTERPAGPAAEPLPVLLPTEILHALYDGGGGASLADYWRLLRSSERLGGAFLWSLFDEGVVRGDRGGSVDTAGNRGADGLLGPYREPEASAGAVREIFSPVQLNGRWSRPQAVEVELQNRFDETDLAACSLRWRWLALPALPEDGRPAEVSAGGERPLPAAAPGETAALRLEVPEGAPAPDAVELVVLAPDGRELTSRVVANQGSERLAAAWRPPAGAATEVRSERQGSRLTLSAASGRWARFDLDSGALVELGDGERRLALGGGARRADGRRAQLTGVEVRPQPGAVEVRAGYRGALNEMRWVFDGRGWLRLDYLFEGGDGDAEYLGVRFDGLEGRVRALTWLGRGPYRAWRNRLAGGRLGLWRTEWNDSVTGVDWVYPELPGFYVGVRWASLATDEGDLVLAPDQPLYLGVLEPRFPPGARTAVAEVPSGISVLHQISAIGTKFHRPQELGPAARRRLPAGRHRGGVWLRFDGAGRSRSADPGER